MLGPLEVLDAASLISDNAMMLLIMPKEGDAAHAAYRLIAHDVDMPCRRIARKLNFFPVGQASQ